MTPTRGRWDPPAVLLGICVHLLGAGRPEWGRAMLAELAQVDVRRARWVFALGCVSTIAFKLPPAGSQRLVTIGAWVSAAASAALVIMAFVFYPGLATGERTWVVLGLFAMLLVAYVIWAMNVGARPVDRRFGVSAVVVGIVISVSWLAIGLDSSLGGPKALSEVLLGLGPLVSLSLGWVATRRSCSARVGVEYVGLTALMAGFALFILWVGETVATAGRPYDSGMLRDFRASGASDLATYAVNDSLGTGMSLLLVVPLVSLASGLLGIAVARERRMPSEGPAR